MTLRIALAVLTLVVLALAGWSQSEVARSACINPDSYASTSFHFERTLLHRTVDGKPVPLPAELTSAYDYPHVTASQCRIGTKAGMWRDASAIGQPGPPVHVTCEFKGEDPMLVELLGADAFLAKGSMCVHEVTIDWQSSETVGTSYEEFRERTDRTK